MLLRRFVAVANLILLALALVAEHYFPAYSTEIFYGLLIWMFASLFLFFGRPVARPTGSPSGSSGAGALPSGPPRSIDFCVYCGTPLAAGATICPACGKTARPI